MKKEKLLLVFSSIFVIINGFLTIGYAVILAVAASVGDFPSDITTNESLKVVFINNIIPYEWFSLIFFLFILVYFILTFLNGAGNGLALIFPVWMHFLCLPIFITYAGFQWNNLSGFIFVLGQMLLDAIAIWMIFLYKKLEKQSNHQSNLS